THSKLDDDGEEILVSHDCGTGITYRYRSFHGKPVLIDFSDSVLSEDAVIRAAAQSPVERRQYSGAVSKIKGLLSPDNEVTRENVDHLVADLEQKHQPIQLLIVGGGSIGQGMDAIYEHPHIRVHSFDIYDSPYVQFIADGHHLPL